MWANGILLLLLLASVDPCADEEDRSEHPVYLRNGQVRVSLGRPDVAWGNVILRLENGRTESVPLEEVDLDKSTREWNRARWRSFLDDTTAQGRPFPRLEFVDTKGRAGVLPDPGGGYTLVEVWATWCGTCLSSMSALKTWAAENPGMKGMRIVTLCYEKSPEQCAKTRARLGIEDLPGWRHAFLKHEVYMPFALGLEIYAEGGETYLLDPKGCVVHSAIHPGLLVDVLDATLEKQERCPPAGESGSGGEGTGPSPGGPPAPSR